MIIHLLIALVVFILFMILTFKTANHLHPIEKKYEQDERVILLSVGVLLSALASVIWPVTVPIGLAIIIVLYINKYLIKKRNESNK